MESMHEYFVKGKDLKIQKIILIVISILCAYIISIFISCISKCLQIDLWWVEVPSVIGFYGIIKNFVDKHLWARFYRIPSFEGVWKGYIRTSNDNFSTDIPVTCIIKQNAKLICIVFEMEKSNSYSISAIINDTNIDEKTLEYNYINIPKVEQNDLLDIHLGSATLKLKEKCLDGEYYNKQRNTKGNIYLEKKEEN